MTRGLLESLAAHDVPPVPAEFDERVHQRLNRALLAAHLVDLALGAVPYLAGHLLRGVVHLMGATYTGKFESDRRDRSGDVP